MAEVDRSVSVTIGQDQLAHGSLRVGIGVLLWLRSRHPDAVGRIGSILGEEGGTDAKLLDR